MHFSVTEIGDSAFLGCITLMSIEIPDSVTTIGWFVFNGCTSLGSVTIGKNVTSIGGGAFKNCESLKSVVLPDSVTLIDLWAFENCTGLLNIAFSDSVTAIEPWAFNGCERLSNVYYSGSEAQWQAISIMDNNEPINSAIKHYNSNSPSTPNNNNENENRETRSSDFEYTTNEEGTVEITKYTGTGGDVVIPSTIEGKNVTQIGQYSFENCTGLTNITIPDTVTTIWWNAFEGCTGLSNVTLPNSVTAIHRSAFRGCIGLSSIKIPASVTSIDERIFYGCTNLSEIKVSVDNPVFADYDGIICDKAIKTVLCCPEGKKGEIKLPDSVTKIDDNAFDSCLGFTSITIPASVTKIGNAAFYDCKNLADVYYSENKESWNKISIDTGNDSLLNAKIHCSDDEERGTLGNFDISRDSWSFLNWKESFGEFDFAIGLSPQGFLEHKYVVKNYYIPAQRYMEVFGADYTAVATLRGEETYKSMIPDFWGGNCFGMATSSALFSINKLDWSAYTENKYTYPNDYRYEIRDAQNNPFSNDTKIYSTSGPNSIKAVTKLIESYQIWTNSSDCKFLLDDDHYAKKIKENDSHVEYEHIANGLYVNESMELIKNANHPLIVGVYWADNERLVGHALLAYAWEKGENGWYKVYVYDCNHAYPSEEMKSMNNRFQDFYTSDPLYLELNPDKNIWRYDTAAAQSNINSELIGSLDEKPITRTFIKEQDGKSYSVTQPDMFQILDPIDAPTHFDGTARSDKLDEEKAKLSVTPESNISIMNESGETICVATSGTVIPLGEGVYYHANVGYTEEDGDYSIGNSTITLPCSKFTIKYFGGDDVTVFGNGEIVNLKFDNDANVDVDLDNLKLNVNSLSDNKMDVQLSRISDNNDLSSVLSTGTLSKDDSILLKLDSSNQFDAQLSDSNSNSSVDIYTQTESSNGRGYIETLSGNKTIQTKVKDQQESNNDNTTQTKSPNNATIGNANNTTVPVNETVSNVTTGDSTKVALFTLLFGFSALIIILTVRKKKIILDN